MFSFTVSYYLKLRTINTNGFVPMFLLFFLDEKKVGKKNQGCILFRKMKLEKAKQFKTLTT